LSTSKSKHLVFAKQILEKTSSLKLSLEQRREKAIELASYMLQEAKRVQTRQDYEMQSELERMMEDPKGKVFTVKMVDQCFRSDSSFKVANQLKYLLKTYGIPSYFTWSKQLQLKTFSWLKEGIGQFLIPLIKAKLRQETARLILPADRKKREKHFTLRKKEGVRLNINHLGEAVLGEEEALSRLNVYLEELSNPEIEYISIKISTIYSQINLLDWDKSLAILSERLRVLYRKAKEHFFVRLDGTSLEKFINLDMEEYKDLHLTADLFKKVLDEPEFFHYTAGIVLQSYLPDAHLLQQQLTMWALERGSAGGAPIKIRLVKGANLCMEKLEASLRGWQQAPYLTKGEVDANFKRMVHYGLKPEHAKVARIGIASHNLFDIAYGLLLRAENSVEEFVEFEMLEGMADDMRQVVQELTGSILLYCPLTSKKNFCNAIAYLIRRLDENTSKENFLHDIFGLNPGTSAWQKQADHFSFACHAQDVVSLSPRRKQNRVLETITKEYAESFTNEADTDFSLSWNRKWAEQLLKEALVKKIDPIASVIAGQSVLTAKTRQGLNPSNPKEPLYIVHLADKEYIEKALETAEIAAQHYKELDIKQRIDLLKNIAYSLKKGRKSLIQAMVLDAGKSILEADAEISEAIDFAEYYALIVQETVSDPHLNYTPRGATLIASPWNFPVAISAGGILAALVTGNSVIFKPALETAYTGFVLAQIFWSAGVSKQVLQFVVCEDEVEGSKLIKDSRIKQVVLTGETDTALKFYKMRQDLHLLAETGGKNAIIVTSMSDRDLATRDIIQSAFGHAGQKCSACSLLILEEEVYNDASFKKQLKDAAQSLKVGPSTDCGAKITPLIHPPEGKLLTALTSLEEGESFLLEPKIDENNPHLCSPGIKWGVKEGSISHKTEFFGPLLSVIKAKDLSHAIQIANSTRYGLTAGLHSLDPREQEFWLKNMEAGNYYVNRGITGAIVQRQPFGGCKESHIGASFKAGGPNYLYPFFEIAEKQAFAENSWQISPSLSKIFEEGKKQLEEKDKKIFEKSLKSYSHFYETLFSKMSDPSKIRGQDNLFGYRAKEDFNVRLEGGEKLLDIYRLLAALVLTKTPAKIFYSSLSGQRLAPLSLEGVDWICEDEVSWKESLNIRNIKHLRLLFTPSEEFLLKASLKGIHLLKDQVFSSGRVELLNYMREYAVSHDFHRYGNLGSRENA
jgi:RHH-type transcriptional regulator, proline utilization regulon repressor / proline dehydrogenase / delta 1-pyrroline-5-carboxylate dehydrogenase